MHPPDPRVADAVGVDQLVERGEDVPLVDEVAGRVVEELEEAGGPEPPVAGQLPLVLALPGGLLHLVERRAVVAEPVVVVHGLRPPSSRGSGPVRHDQCGHLDRDHEGVDVPEKVVGAGVEDQEVEDAGRAGQHPHDRAVSVFVGVDRAGDVEQRQQHQQQRSEAGPYPVTGRAQVQRVEQRGRDEHRGRRQHEVLDDAEPHRPLEPRGPLVLHHYDPPPFPVAPPGPIGGR